MPTLTSRTGPVQQRDMPRLRTNAGNAGDIAVRKLLEPAAVIVMGDRNGLTGAAIAEQFGMLEPGVAKVEQEGPH